ncbi:MAG TPA: GntR family transcriptional regulator [Candidatus Acidoferrales bacterium]|nr:GntR family transcriptional regulator [Candidatus Acidoferrales bacterium]
MATIFTVDPRSGVPLYVQLRDQMKRAVALGVLSPGERLPTVKALALELTINPNTVARVYRELENEGVIETSPGRGSFVARGQGRQSAVEACGDVARAVIADAIRHVRALGLERALIREIVDDEIARWYAPALEKR